MEISYVLELYHLNHLYPNAIATVSIPETSINAGLSMHF